jgi:hypothetical protein
MIHALRMLEVSHICNKGQANTTGIIKREAYEDCFLMWQVLHHVAVFHLPSARITMVTAPSLALVGSVIISWPDFWKRERNCTVDSTKWVRGLHWGSFGEVPSVPTATLSSPLFQYFSAIAETIILAHCSLQNVWQDWSQRQNNLYYFYFKCTILSPADYVYHPSPDTVAGIITCLEIFWACLWSWLS